MHLCADFHAGPRKGYLIFFLFALNSTQKKWASRENPLKECAVTPEKHAKCQHAWFTVMIKPQM